MRAQRTSESLGKQMHKLWSDPAYRERMRKAHLGYKHTPEAKAKMTAALHERYKTDPHARQKAAKGGRQPRSPEYWEANRKRLAKLNATPKHIEANRRAHLGKKRSPETREKIRQKRLRQRLPVKMTSIERALMEQFKKRRLKFEMNKSMFGRFQPDFVFESVKLIVQADGDYWHRQSTVNVERDQRFNVRAEETGWTVWRFAESEIVQHPEACGRAVARFVRSH